MVIDNKQKFIFIHVIKTGGSSITKTLGGQNRSFAKHRSYNSLPEDLKKKNYFSFGFVRNPWSLAYSFYNYIKRKNEDRVKNKDFKKFILDNEKNILNHRDGYDFRQLPCVSGCKFIGRFELLQSDFDTACKYMNIGRKILGTVNKSYVKKDYREVYNDKMKEIISTSFKEDINYFGFTFNSCATKNIGLIR